jgi:hypothetical protein
MHRSPEANLPDPAPVAPRKPWGRLMRVMGLMGLGLSAASAPVAAQVPAAPVPQHWISYAQMAGNQFQGRLSDPADETVQRLHAWMQKRMLQEAQPVKGEPVPPPPLVVRVWVAAGGQVERVAFDSLGDAQADADLRTLMTAQPLSEPPPRDMRQPMVLQLTLSFVTTS